MLISLTAESYEVHGYGNLHWYNIWNKFHKNKLPNPRITDKEAQGKECKTAYIIISLVLPKCMTMFTHENSNYIHMCNSGNIYK